MYTVDIFLCGSLVERLVIVADNALAAIDKVIKVKKLGGAPVGKYTYEARTL